MFSRKLLTFGLVASGCFLIFTLTSTILVSGKSLNLIGKIIPLLFLVYMSFGVARKVSEIKKGNFLTNKQGVLGVSLFALLGEFSAYVGYETGRNIVSQMLFRLGVGLTIIALSFLFASLGVWVNNHWLSKSE